MLTPLEKLKRLQKIAATKGVKLPAVIPIAIRQLEKIPIKKIPTGGGITVKPWWDILPKTPAEVVTRTLAEPAIVPIGGAAVVFKHITKQAGGKLLPAALIGGGGLLAGLFLGGRGGQEQEQQQDILQAPTVTPTVTPTVIPIVTPTVTPTITPTVTPTVSVMDSIIHGDVGTTTLLDYIYTLQPTETITETTTITPTYTWTGAAQEQEAKAEQGIGLLEIAIIGGALLGAAYLMKRR